MTHNPFSQAFLSFLIHAFFLPLSSLSFLYLFLSYFPFLLLSSSSSSSSSFFILRQVLIYPRLASNLLCSMEQLGIPHIPDPTECQGSGSCVHHILLVYIAWGSNPGLGECQTSCLPTKLHPASIFLVSFLSLFLLWHLKHMNSIQLVTISFLMSFPTVLERGCTQPSVGHPVQRTLH